MAYQLLRILFYSYEKPSFMREEASRRQDFEKHWWSRFMGKESSARLYCEAAGKRFRKEFQCTEVVEKAGLDDAWRGHYGHHRCCWGMIAERSKRMTDLSAQIEIASDPA